MPRTPKRLQPEPAAPPSLRWAWPVLLVVATFVVYIPAMDGGFVWDDDRYVETNQALRDVDGLLTIWFEFDWKKRTFPLNQYYPMVYTGLWLQYQLWGLETVGYHLVNIALHAGNALLLWLALKRLRFPVAGFAAAVFALHPVHVESVAWITELKNVMSGMFYLLALLAYMKFCPLAETEPPKAFRWKWYGVAMLMYVLALLSKSVTCSLPAAIVLILWWKRDRLAMRDLVPLAPMFGIGLLLGLMTAVMEKNSIGANGPEWDFSFVERTLIAGRALWFYAGKLFFPVNLTFIYPKWSIDPSSIVQWIAPTAVVVVMAVLLLRRKRYGNGPLAAVCFFAGTLFPALGYFNIYPMRYSFVADHFQYLASIGVIVLGVGVAVRLLPRSAASRGVVGAVVLGLLAVQTARQATAYEDLETLWRDTVEKNPTGWMGLVSLGAIMKEKGELTEAEALYRRALESYPDAPEAHYNLGVLLSDQQLNVEAIKHYRAALKVKPVDYGTHNNLGLVLDRLDQLDEALRHYQIAIDIDPKRPGAYANLGVFFAKRGRLDDAIAVFKRGLERVPNDPNISAGLQRATMMKRAAEKQNG